jgi:hypothetical protein
MKTKALFLSGLALALVTLACSLTNESPVPILASTSTPLAVPTEGSAQLPPPTVPVTSEPPTVTPPTATAVTVSGLAVSFAGTSFTIPEGLATGSQNDIVAQANDPNIPFELHPAYTRITLQGYPLQGRAFEAQVMVYPLQDFIQISDSAAGIINNLQTLLAAQTTSPADHLPFLPFINAGQVFDQAPLPINNTELLYTFQGITSDGAYYVSVTLPISAPFLPADNNLDSPIPPDGIPFPTDFSAFPNYLTSVTDRLNHSDFAFGPSIAILDTLVQSIAAYGMH